MKKSILLFSLFIFSFSLCEGQSWSWAKQASGYQADGINGAVDTSGNAYITGETDGVVFGTYSIGGGNTDMYLAKYDANGNVLWAKGTTFNQSHSARGDGVSTDNKLNVYVSGPFAGNIILGSDTLFAPTVTFNSFIVKYDASGNELWARQCKVASAKSTSEAYSVAVDIKGNSFLSGYFTDTISFGAFNLISPSGSTPFIVKYNSAGTLLWAKQSTGAGYGMIYSSCTDHKYNCYVTGYFAGNITFGTTTLTAGYNNIFVVKYDSNGNVIWARQSNGQNCDGRGITSDLSGNVYVSGNFTDSLRFGSYHLYSGKSAIFIAKFDSNGNLSWAKQSVSTDATGWYGLSISSDNNYNIYMSGGNWGYGNTKYTSTLSFGSLVLSATNEIDASIIVKFDSSGKPLCGNMIQTGGDDWNNVSVNPNGDNIYFSSDVYTSCKIGPDTLIMGGQELPFIARWQPCSVTEGTGMIHSGASSITLFPNPSTGTFTLQVNSEQLKVNSVVEIYNVLGECVFKEILRSTQDDNRIELNQPNGIYLYRVLNEDGSLIGEGKVVKE